MSKKKLNVKQENDEQQELKENDYVIDELGTSLRMGLTGINTIPPLVQTILEKQAWKKRVVSQTGQIVEFNSFAEFLAAYPPEGLHTSFKDLWRMCDGHEAIQEMLDKAMQRSQGATKGNQRASKNKTTVDNINSSFARPTGTSKQHAMRKLSKYAEIRPDVATALEEVKVGRLSANRALINTGLKKPESKKIALVSPEAVASKLIQNLAVDELRELHSAIGEYLNSHGGQAIND